MNSKTLLTLIVLRAILVRLSPARYMGDKMTILAELGTGMELYYSFDTHWNQRGHNLAAQTIVSYLEDMLAINASKKEMK